MDPKRRWAPPSSGGSSGGPPAKRQHQENPDAAAVLEQMELEVEDIDQVFPVDLNLYF